MARTRGNYNSIGEFTFEQLLELNRYEDYHCSMYWLSKREEICNRLNGNLKGYCEQCVRHIKSYCRAKPATILANTVNSFLLQTLEKQVQKHIQQSDHGYDYPESLHVVDFLHSIGSMEFHNYQTVCRDLEAALTKQGDYFGLEKNNFLSRLPAPIYRSVQYCKRVLEVETPAPAFPPTA